MQQKIQIGVVFLGPPGVGKTTIVSQLTRSKPHNQSNYFLESRQQKKIVTYQLERKFVNQEILFHLFDTGGIEELKWSRQLAYKSIFKNKVGVMIFDKGRCQQFVELQKKFISEWRSNVQYYNSTSIIVIANFQDKIAKFHGQEIEGLRDIIKSKCKKLNLLFFQSISYLGPDTHVDMSYILDAAYALTMCKQKSEYIQKKYIQKCIQDYARLPIRYKDWKIENEQKNLRLKWNRQLGVKILVIKNNYEKLMEKLRHFWQNQVNILGENAINRQKYIKLAVKVSQFQSIRQLLTMTNQNKDKKQIIQKVIKQIRQQKQRQLQQYLQRNKKQHISLTDNIKQITTLLDGLIFLSKQIQFGKNITSMKQTIFYSSEKSQKIHSNIMRESSELLSDQSFIKSNNSLLDSGLINEIQTIAQQNQLLKVINTAADQLDQLFTQFNKFVNTHYQEDFSKFIHQVPVKEFMCKIIDYYCENGVSIATNISNKEQIQISQSSISDMKIQIGNRISQLLQKGKKLEKRIHKALQQLKDHELYPQFIKNKMDIIEQNQQILKNVIKQNRSQQSQIMQEYKK